MLDEAPPLRSDFREMPTADGIVVTVLIVTYNHEGFIRRAVDSALAQHTDFPVEILISEDASTDRTREIVERYAEEFADRVRLLLSSRNLKSNEVVARGLRAARGRYVALLDGDDYWTSTRKLQTQAGYLDGHPDCALCFHNVHVARGSEVSTRRWTPSHQKPVSTIAELWSGNPFATCGSMMRMDCLRAVPDWYDGFFPITDWPLYLLCAERGNVAFADEVMGVYRLHDEGLFSALPDRKKLDAIADFYRRMNRCLGYRHDHLARGGCSRYFFDWAKEYLRLGDVAAARACFCKGVFGGGIGLAVTYREALRVGLRVAAGRVG